MLTRHSLVKTLIIFLFSGVFLLSCELQVNNQLLVKSKPTKIEYYVGDKLDLEGLVVTSINRKGKESLITDFSVEPENGTILKEAGTQYVTVSYKDCTVDFEIVVKDYTVEKLYITSIPKLAYYVGEKLDLSDLKVEALYNNGSVIEISDYVSEPKDGSVLEKTESGKQTVTIKYKEKECTFDIRICENELENLTIDSIPEYTVYYCGDLLDISDLKVLAKFSDGTEVYVEDYNLSIPDKSDLLEPGQQLVEISYLNKQVDFAINVLEPIVTIIEAPQNKSINLYDETKLKASVSVVGNGDVYFEWYRKINENEDFVCLEKSESVKNDKNQVYVTELKVNPNPYVQPEFESYVIVKNNKFEIIKKIGSSIIKQNIETDLPVCIINSNNIPIVSTTRDIESKISIVDKENPLENIDAVVRVRGNATATYPKRPYKIKFNKKTSVLGMDKNKSWVLLANYCDKSLMRPAIGFKTSELLNMPWTPKFKYVELVLNGEYLGNYQLVESVKEGENRVNIDESGYLIEIDDSYYYREPVYFTTSTKNHFYSYKYPDYENITADINNYIKNWIDDFEKILYSDDDIAFDLETGYSKYIDIDSWARNFICQNILKNGDTNFFMHKYDNTDNSKLERSPLWDFEWSIGIGWYYGERPNPEHGLIIHPYYERLLDDPVFKAYVKNIWNTECNNIKQDLLSYYDDLEELLYKSQELNFKRWDILNKRVSVGGIPLGSIKAEVECDKQYLSNHIDWFDQTINEL